jgi:MFS family permease
VTQRAASASAWRIILTATVALAVAMGIGRFAFTPLLPMMLADGVVDIATASWLASANYLGYLLGALLCTFQPWLWRKLVIVTPVNSPLLVLGGLVATAVLTLGMALPWPGTWPALRFAAGVASAFVFIHTSSWCLTRLSRVGLPALGALVYAGPGGGIVLTGLAATVMVAWHGSATLGWLIFGVLAALLTAGVWPVLATTREGSAAAAPQASPPGASEGQSPHGLEVAMLATAYGLAGFGYIITATFLPVIARQSLADSAWLDLFWPILGAGTVLGVMIASRLRGHADQRLRLAACYLVQALGIAASLWSPTLAGFAIGSLLLGLPFTAITFFALQEVRRMRPAAPSGLMGLITAMYGLGQIVGPPLAAALVARSPNPAEGFALSLEIAAAGLVLGALIYFFMARIYPQAHSQGRH